MTSSSPNEGKPRKLLPPVWLLFSLIAMVALHAALPGPVLLSGTARWLGAAPIGAGIAVILWAAGLFARRETTIIPFRESSALVIAGPYRFTRNPMYLGMTGILSGTAWMLGTTTPWICVACFVWWIQTRFIAVEERMLTARFGDSYREFQRRVRRWI